ncbi:hypothetical protein CFOL_v3_34047 [Cephalotus follicularis]|uniref:Uncharacterized protein n=1 Tax=Cephalotus follicularis TaxID=3775 RepID=A0A1Q3DDT8_CEPFO|nr:hypothetical protein CFOL_v3_34047 [Cephalotus follicularis]
MSTDLELCKELRKFSLPSTKIKTQQSPEDSTEDNVSSIEHDHQQNSRSSSNDECQTPTSEEHKIPALLFCPPAPRKPRPTFSCKRRLQFFEIVNPEEIDNFFRSSFDNLVTKRRCIKM